MTANTSAPRGTKRRAPARQCVACRTREDRERLLRLVEGPDGAIAVDVRSRAGGRGAWVHSTRGCILTAARKHLAERSLKLDASSKSADQLVRDVRDALRRKCHSLVLVAQRKRAISVGAEAAIDTLERTRVALLLIATDATESHIAGRAQRDRGDVPVRTMGTRTELGAMLGREQVAIAALTDARIGEELIATLDCLSGLEGR